MEIVPDEELFEGSDKVVGTMKLLDRLNKEDDEFVIQGIPQALWIFAWRLGQAQRPVEVD
jgi:hypothetical protein